MYKGREGEGERERERMKEEIGDIRLVQMFVFGPLSLSVLGLSLHLCSLRPTVEKVAMVTSH